MIEFECDGGMFLLFGFGWKGDASYCKDSVGMKASRSLSRIYALSLLILKIVDFIIKIIISSKNEAIPNLNLFFVKIVTSLNQNTPI